MKKFFFLLLLVGISSVHAEEPQPFSNRVLFVIETSSTMKRSAETAREVVAQLVESGAQEQLKAGDTFGVWTFNETLNTSYPMQRWTPENARQLATATTNFLTKVSFEKKGQLAAFWPALMSIVDNSKAITVILISSGNDPIHGTPFDSQINIPYANYARQLHKIKALFVTSLIGRNGKIVAYAVNSSLAIQIPKVAPPTTPPKPKLFPETNAVSATTNVVAAPRRYAKQNIIITKSSATNVLPTTNSTKNVLTNAEPKVAVSGANPIATATLSNAIPTNNIVASAKIQEPASTNQNSEKIISAETNTSTIKTNSAAKTLTANANAMDVVTNSVVVTNAVTVTNVVQVTNSVPVTNEVPLPVSATATPSSKNKFLLIGAGLFVIAIGLIALVVRSTRRNSKPSLISRSMDK